MDMAPSMVVMVNPNGYRIVSSVAISGENPYTRLFYEALAPWGVQTTGPFEATRPWLEDHENEFDALHFHWPEWVVQRDSPWVRRICGVRGGWRLRSPLRWVSRFVNLQELRRFLREAKSREKRIIWTCHNLKPHEDRGRAVEEAIRAVACSADLIITHDAAALSRLRTTVPPAGSPRGHVQSGTMRASTHSRGRQRRFVPPSAYPGWPAGFLCGTDPSLQGPRAGLPGGVEARTSSFAHRCRGFPFAGVPSSGPGRGRAAVECSSDRSGAHRPGVRGRRGSERRHSSAVPSSHDKQRSSGRAQPRTWSGRVGPALFQVAPR